MFQGRRDRRGAIVQPESCGRTMPYARFILEPGSASDTVVKRLPLRPDAVRDRILRRPTE
jgi:hypothetical protein